MKDTVLPRLPGDLDAAAINAMSAKERVAATDAMAEQVANRAATTRCQRAWETRYLTDHHAEAAKRERDFLRCYRALVESFGLHISACGCCGGPAVDSIDASATDAHLHHLGEDR